MGSLTGTCCVISSHERNGDTVFLCLRSRHSIIRFLLKYSGLYKLSPQKLYKKNTEKKTEITKMTDTIRQYLKNAQKVSSVFTTIYHSQLGS